MAQTIKLKRSGTAGAAPTTSNLALGEVAINTYDGKMYIKKSVGGTESIVEIGGSGTGSVSYLEAGMVEYEYTATSNQTTFSGSDSNSATLSYTANSIMVFLNGVLQDDGVDYTATNGTSVVFTSALTANDEVRIIAIDTVASTSSLQNPTKLDAITTVNNQAAYSLTVNSSAYTPSSQNALIVSLNGITQEPGDSFTISGSTITFSPALVTGDVVDYIVDMGRAVTIGQYDSDLVVSGELEVTGDIIGDLRGAILFKAQAGENLTKCDAVYISGISGNTTVVSKADADDAAKMPAFGIVAASATSGQPVDIYTFGTLSSVDTSTPGWSIGDELYVSTTPGALTNSAPTGESASIQKIAKVTRVDSSSGSIKIMGAGRSNATPNLNDGNIFIGNASNQVTTASLNTKIEDYLDAGTSTPTFSTLAAGNTTLTGYLRGPSTFTIDPATHGDDTGTLVVAGNLQVDGTTTTINSTTMTVDDLNITLASGAANASAANGAGITVDGASASLTYDGTNDEWDFNKNVKITGTVETSSGLILAGHPVVGYSSITGGYATRLGSTGTSTLNVTQIYARGAHVATFDGATGNVGIGITNPDKKLVVSGVGAEIVINDTDTTDTPRLRFRESGSTSGSISTDAGEMRFDTSSTERMRIDASGNVGIGTNIPAVRLHIQEAGTGAGGGGVISETATAGGNAGFRFRTGGTDRFNIVTIGSAGSEALRIYDYNNAVERMRIRGDGNVGIGTTNPGGILHLRSDDNGIIFQSSSSSNSRAQIFFQNTGGTTTGKIAVDPDGGNANVMAFSTGSTERMRIDSAGDIYIGNNGSAATRVVEISGTNTGTNPAANGHIAGELRLRNVSATDNNHSAVSWYNSNNAVDSRITGVHKSHSSRYGELAFLTHNGSALGERMRIDRSGNVGIGTTNPAYTLDVNGQINATSVSVGGTSLASTGKAIAMAIVFGG